MCSAPMVIPQGHADIVLEQLGSDEVLLDVKRPCGALVRVRWSPTGSRPEAAWSGRVTGRA